MPKLAETFLIFPLFIMLMVTLVSLNIETLGDSTASLDVFGTRDVTDAFATLADNYVQSSYDNYGENPNDTGDGGNWTGGEGLDFVEDIAVIQNNEYGVEDGHATIAFTLVAFMRDLYDENTRRANENEVRYYIGLDPEAMEEWAELQSGGFTLDDVLVFIAIFTGLIILVGIIGIRIFGIGLADTSIQTILTLTALVLLWGLLSASAYGFLDDIPVLGPLFWVALTFMYMAGSLLFVIGGD